MQDISKFRGVKGQPLIPISVTKYWRGQKPYSGEDKFVDDFFPQSEESIFSTKAASGCGCSSRVGTPVVW